MTFPFNAYVLASLSAFCTAWATLPLWRKWCIRTGVIDDPGHRKIHAKPIPLAGGLTVMTALILPTLAGWAVLRLRAFGLSQSLLPESGLPAPGASLLEPVSLFLLGYGFGHRSVQLCGVLFGAVGMLSVGWLDDKYELRAAAKFAGQLAVAGLVAASGVRITLFVPSLLFSYAITVLWLLTVVNAFNFMDNMNGLCAGVGAIGAWFFAVTAASQGQYLVGLIAFLAFGALLGFIPYNFPKASAFLGDAGSHLVGYLMAVLAILPHFYTVSHPRAFAVFIPLLVLAAPLLDLLWVVVLRWRLGRPFYVGDTNHLSHRLVRLGLTPVQAVLLIWLAAAVFGAAACLIGG